MGFRYALRLSDGSDAGEGEYGYQPEAGIQAFSPHDLRHRRATLWHLGGIPVVEAAAWLGHSPNEHLKTYAHATLVDRSELGYEKLVSVTRGRDVSLDVDEETQHASAGRDVHLIRGRVHMEDSGDDAAARLAV